MLLCIAMNETASNYPRCSMKAGYCYFGLALLLLVVVVAVTIPNMAFQEKTTQRSWIITYYVLEIPSFWVM